MSGNLFTVPQIARLLGVGQHRVDYVCRTRRDIEPAGLAGKVRLYSGDTVKHIASELLIERITIRDGGVLRDIQSNQPTE